MRLLKLLISSKFMLVLLISFALAMAVATFIENDFGTPAAWSLIYESWWFEMIMVLLAINFLANIQRYQLFSRKKWPIGLFHVAFVIIILAAGITRYFSHAGTIHIREGQAQNTYYSQEKYLQVRALKEGNSQRFFKPLKLTDKTFQATTVSLPFQDQLSVNITRYIPHAKPEFMPGEQDYLDMAVTMGSGREDMILPIGKNLAMNDLQLATDEESASPIKIYKTDSTWMIASDVHLQVMQMSNQQLGVLHSGDVKPLKLRSLYQWENGAFVIKGIHENSQLTYEEVQDPKLAEQLPDAVLMEVLDHDGQVIDRQYVSIVKLAPEWRRFRYQDTQYEYTYGPKAHTLPFSLYLKDFEMQRYPGSQSPSSYASNLVVEDATSSFDYRIYMNNVLDHGGYRFYQASYDMDEQGTVLSINQDRLGSTLTYVGYFLLGLGMFFTLFTYNSRFRQLNQHLKKIKAQTVLLGLMCLPALGQGQTMDQQAEWVVPEGQAEQYGMLVVQDLDGRMKPLNTLANEIVRKLSGKTTVSLEGSEVTLNPEQLLLAVQMYPEMMGSLPLIKIDAEKGQMIYEWLGLSPTGKVSFLDFLDRKSVV